MQVGRVRGVLPRGVLHLLFVFVVVVAAVPYAHDWWRHGYLSMSITWYYATLGAVGIGCWLMSIMTDIAVGSRPDRFVVAFVVRGVMAATLVALIVALVVPYILMLCGPAASVSRNQGQQEPIVTSQP